MFTTSPIAATTVASPNATCCSAISRAGDMLTQMVLDDLVHQAVDRATRSGDLLQDRRAGGIGV
jgi:hypothetical protein